MAAPIELEPHEQILADGIRDLLRTIKQSIAAGDGAHELRGHIAEMGRRAHALHESLRQRNPALEPRHHRYMIRNRGMEPGAPTFYDHVHPVEDLLAFLADPEANADPADQTIGAKFSFEVYSRRWGHRDRYHVTRTGDGWEIGHMSTAGACDKRGIPALYAEFTQDSINYPEALPDYLEYLWEQASAEGAGLSSEEVQVALDQLADWVSAVEEASPSGVFRGYK